MRGRWVIFGIVLAATSAASLAQAADERQVGGHHRDLAKLGERHRPGEPGRVDDLGPGVCSPTACDE